MGRKRGKKPGGQKEKQAPGGQPKKEFTQKAGISGEEHPGPLWPPQRKEHVEPALRSGGGDVTAKSSQQPQGKRYVAAGPSQQPQGERYFTAGPSQQPQGERYFTAGPSQQPQGKRYVTAGPSQQPQGERYVEAGPSQQPQGKRDVTAGPSQQPQGERDVTAGPSQQPQGKRYVAAGPSQQPQGERDVTAGPFQQPQEHRPQVALQSLPQPPQACVQRKGLLEGTPPCKAFPHETLKPTPPSAQPPPGMKGPWGQPHPLIRPAVLAPATGCPEGPPPSQELVAFGAQGPRGVTAPISQAESSSAAPSAITKGALEIPKRKGCGTKGRKTVVETNYLSLDLSKLRNSIAYHYDVEFLPALPKRLLRRAMEEFRQKHFPKRYPAFDGRKNLYTSQELPEISDTVNVHDEESQQDKKFKITIKYATQINMESLVTYMRSGSSVAPPQDAVQALDVVLRSAHVSRGFVQVGRSFFSPPTGGVVELSGGLEMWYGVFQSAILGWKPFLNIDVAHKGFLKQQEVVDAIEEICMPRQRGVESHRQRGDELDFRQKKDFLGFIRGLKVDYMLRNDPPSKRIYRVNGIAECPAKLWFEWENNQSISVQEYYSRTKGVPLQYPHLPCLAVGSVNRKKPIYLPPELCVVSGSQVINKKMNEKQISAMIRSAATSTDVRKGKIMKEVEEIKFNNVPCIQEFEISVGDKFERVDARILDAPELQYKQKKCTLPQGGKWWPSNFIASGRLGAWMILTLDASVKEETLRSFGEQMQKKGGTLGMEIQPPLRPHTMNRPRPDELESFFRSMKKSKVGLVVVVVPDKKSYVMVKKTAELTVGLLTQCIKSATIRNLKEATCSNILLKVNSKLNGINHTLAAVSKPRCLQSPAMIVGADVTHPPPGQDKPSVAAVCATHDPQAFKYNIQIRLQPPRVEIIKDMEAIMKQHLLFFYQSNNTLKPERIIFYRDGVSEGQFCEVLKSEVNAIRRACASFEQGYEPPVTFLVVQKRHHTRFFPIKREDEDGKDRNVPAGTVVDTQITHPTELDFFLASHASIEGVTRPTKYHLLWNDDDNMTTDEIEQLTYYLCHLFSRCTRSVSYPAPTYYAHLAAYRAGVYLDGSTINLVKLENEQKKYFECDVLKNIIEENPMYFV